MSILQITARASVALTMAAALTCGTVAMASAAPAITKYPCYGDGVGATSQAAEAAARSDLYGNYSTVYLPILLVSDTQQSNGTWAAEVIANCSGMPR